MRKTTHLCDRCGEEFDDDSQITNVDFSPMGPVSHRVADDEDADLCLKCFSELEVWWSRVATGMKPVVALQMLEGIFDAIESSEDVLAFTAMVSEAARGWKEKWT